MKEFEVEIKVRSRSGGYDYIKENIKVEAFITARQEVDKIVAQRYPNGTITRIREIFAEPSTSDSRSSAPQMNSNSSGASRPKSSNSTSGCATFLVIGAIACIGGYFYLSKSTHSDTEAPVISESATASTEHAQEPVKTSDTNTSNLIAPVPSAPDGTQVMPTSNHDTGRDKVTSATVAAAQFPFPAKIIGRNTEVVLQSKPGITSKNLSKLPTGSFVYASSKDGKWIRVLTTDGLIGFVRLRQLEFEQDEVQAFEP